MRSTRYVLASTAMLCSLALAPSGSRAQEQTQEQEPRAGAAANANAQGKEGSAAHAAHPNAQAGGFRIMIPPAQGALEIVAEGPAEARMHSGIEYRLTVRNVTENLMLHDIVLADGGTSTAKVESIALAPEEQGQNARQRVENEPPAERPAEAPAANQDENRDQQQGLTASGDGSWTIAQLGPGQSKTLLVRASAGEEGRATTCLTVKSWQPAICLMTEVTKPEIQITKKAPERASLCEPFEIEYTITNPGTGDIQAFTLRDPLPEGLRLIDDKEELAYQVDGLKAGDSRNFVARVIAERPGEYRSRAEAVAGENLQARSAEVTTTVSAAELAVQIDGPTQTYVNRNMTYTAFVTNAGQAPARNATLAIQLPRENLRLIDVGSLRRSDRRVQANEQTADRDAEPTAAQTPPAQNAEQQVNPNQNQNSQPNDPQLAAAETIEIGDLAPGETRQVAFVVRATKDGTFPVQAMTSFVCGEREDDRTQAVAQTQVEVLSLAALAIGVADEQDPIAVGKQATYLVTVVNEGTAPDQNIQVTAQVPQNYEFVQGEGQTEVKNEGGTITFAPLDTLGPGDKAEWRVTLQAKQPGNVRFEIDVTSDKSADNVAAAEPTTLFEEK